MPDNNSISLLGDASPSDPDVLRSLFSALLKTRLLEERLIALHRTGRIACATLPTLGGEATEIGACIGLQPDDSFCSSQAKLAAHVVRGTPLHQILADMLRPSAAKVNSPTGTPETFRLVPQTGSLTGQFTVAAGVALAYRNLGKTNVVVALADDGLAALGSWHEAASLASRHRLPLIFMIENCAQSHHNFESAVNSNGDLRDRAEAYGFPGITVDGSDIVAVWRVTQESIHRARTGAGPTLIECSTWRWHVEDDGASSNGRTRPKPESARWQNDPLHHMEHYMKKRSLWRQAWTDQLAAQYTLEIANALKA
jgi:pyruvate dehydrogenase E1 component alpha subunit